MDPTMQQGSSNKLWYIIGAVVIVALAAWYFAGRQAAPAPTESTAAAISSEFDQIPDDSAALDQDQAASAQGVQGF